ncbi:MAG: zinc ABC transporter substrate-binding protein [Mycobacterium sp.]|nr:zinc ABC transporter substrate-binding protein [Mycobacterium sp.]
MWRGLRWRTTTAGRAALAALTLAVLAGCAGNAGASGGPVRVVAAENFWGDITAQIGGRHVAVSSIITNPNTDPHTYETSPANAAAISSAQLVIENGLGYDDFVGKILATGASGSRRVLSVQQVLGLHGANVNPHVWYDTAALPKVAAAIARQLSQIDPAHRGAYLAGAHRFDRSLHPLLAIIATIRRKYAGAPIAYTERVPGYLVQAAGLRLATPVSFSLALEDGTDPSPQDTAAFDAAITAHRVRVLLYNAQVVDAQTERIKQLAARAGVPIVGVSETLPPGQSFQAWQLHQDHQLLRALGG